MKRFIASMLLGCLVLLPAESEAAQRASHSRTGLSTSGLQLDPASGVKIELASYYNSIPPTGYLPVQVRIKNDSGRPGTWRFAFETESGYLGKIRTSYVRYLSVGAGDERYFELLVPVQAGFRNQYSYGNLQMKVQVRGPGVVQGNCFQSSYDGWGSNQTPFLGMGTALALRSWSLMEEEGRKRSSFLRGSTVEPGLLPADWRGYAGLECLWLTDEEWRSLQPDARSAALDWIAQGGQLTIFAQNIPPEGLVLPGLEKMAAGGGEHGFGGVTVRMWDGKELNPQDAFGWLKATSDTLPSQLIAGYKGPWSLLEFVGETTVNTIFYLAFVVGFALLIGPVNLFLLAHGSNRHRLFWTTPMISLAASIVLSGAIVLKDGFGGSGARMSLCRLIPEEKKVLVIQEQVAKTGVMLDRKFRPAERFLIAPVATDEKPANDSWEFMQDEDVIGGDWFRTRATQAHLLEAVRPTRWRVERIAQQQPEGGELTAPVLLSTIGANLRELYYFDGQSVVWKASNVRAGERATLAPATRSEYDRWWGGVVGEGGARLKFALNASVAKAGWFYATTDDAKEVMLETSPGIDWKKNSIVFMGPCPEVELQQAAEGAANP